MLTSLSIRLDTILTLEAFKVMIVRRQPGFGIILKLGECSSTECIDELKRHAFQVSIAPESNSYENARKESFFKTPKYSDRRRIVHNQEKNKLPHRILQILSALTSE